jgi:hypothetical protein
MENVRRTAMGSLRLLGLIGQHLAAPIMSFGISYATAIAVLFFSGILHLGPHGFTVGCGVVGFCGVMMGARCLPTTTRRFGSICLLHLGLFYFYQYIGSWGPEVTDEGTTVNMYNTSLEQLIFLAFGGLTAVIVIWWTSSLEQVSRGPNPGDFTDKSFGPIQTK